jgi:gluconolactonase
MRLLPLSAATLALAALVARATRAQPPARTPAYPSVGSIERLDPALDALVPRGARIEKLAEGFEWSEGPVWRRDGGYLLFTDIPRNTIHRWDARGGLAVFLRPAGYTGHAGPNAPGRELGANGLALDARGALVMADHGNRQVARLDESTFVKTTLADRHEGKRLNSPNDLVFRSTGDLYFTDPPYGLAKLNEDPAKELPFNGVYRRSASGELTLLTRELSFPNGVALSPDERTLYVAVSDPARPVIMAYDLAADGTIARGRVLFDASPLLRQGRRGLPDGLKVDRHGNLFATGPGGVLVLAPDGRHLGTILTGQLTANCAWGDDGATLYMTAHSQLLRIRLGTRGAGY